jgi:hypothetical protein
MKIPNCIKNLFDKPPKKLENCKCGKPGVHGFLKGDGKTKESYAECEECFKKNIRKLTIKALKQTIHEKGLDMCPECGLRGKHAPSTVKYCLKFYMCPNGHAWTLTNQNETQQQRT